MRSHDDSATKSPSASPTNLTSLSRIITAATRRSGRARVGIEAHDCACEFGPGAGILADDQRIVAGNDIAGRIRKPMQSPESLEHVRHAVYDRKRPLLLHVGVQVRCVRSQDQPAAPRE